MRERTRAFDGLISRMNTGEGKVSELKEMSIETSKTEVQRGKRVNKTLTEQNFQGLWNNYKRYHIHIIGMLEEEESKKRNI